MRRQASARNSRSERGTVWFLRSRRLADDMTGTIAYFKPGVEALSASLPTLLSESEKAAIDELPAGVDGCRSALSFFRFC